jgi:predicted RNase H-like HicB family nuclease
VRTRRTSPGAVVADTRDEARESVRKAIEMHLEGLRADGAPIPEPSGEFVEVT